ncbi:MAG: hypothetical protein Q9163_003341 [Psora crenata]
MTQPGKSRGRPRQTWSRLKAAKQDSLESIGLPSKGDESLLDARSQECYYSDILHRCLHINATQNDGSSLDGAIGALSVRGDDPEQPTVVDRRVKEALALDRLNGGDSEISRDVSIVIQAMRKLREAIVATCRIDVFAQEAYAFIIRATILLKHVESYHPALLHLLNRIQPRRHLSENTLKEMLGYHILDLACRQQDLNAAYRVRFTYGLHDTRIDDLLNAIVHGNWLTFWKIDGLVDRYQECLIQAAHYNMRRHTLQCFGKSYLSIERGCIEKATHAAWDELQKSHGVSWQTDGQMVTIRQISRK